MAGHPVHEAGMSPDILCIGSVLWDIIGRTPARMAAGASGADQARPFCPSGTGFAMTYIYKYRLYLIFINIGNSSRAAAGGTTTVSRAFEHRDNVLFSRSKVR